MISEDDSYWSRGVWKMVENFLWSCYSYTLEVFSYLLKKENNAIQGGSSQSSHDDEERKEEKKEWNTLMRAEGESNNFSNH